MANATRRGAAAVSGGAVLLACVAGPVGAQSAPGLPLRARTTVAAATMVSDSQRSWLGYDGLGAVGSLELGYALWPSVELRVGAAFGGFPAKDRTGGLLQPQLGAAVIWPDSGTRPWLQLDAGLGFTGALLRPVVRVSAGVDFQLSNSLSLGPVIGYSHLFQHDLPGASTDARFLWLGFAFGLGPGQSVTRVRVEERVQERVITHTRELDPEPASAPSPPLPAAEVPVAAPSPELNALLETALPSQRQEWLAPVLFSLDSAELEPQGVAMLHEVANELTRRKEIHAVEIRGYADARGDVEHNLQLSERRAQTVRAWLIAHGIASERLRVAPHGASDFVEDGSSESQHAQNRRVVFRVVTEGAAP